MVLQELIDHLQSIADGKQLNKPCSGLCDIVVNSAVSDSLYELFGKAMKSVLKTWEHTSYNSMFPISHPSYKCPYDAYMKTDDLWAGEYGRRRRELSGIVAEKLREYTMIELLQDIANSKVTPTVGLCTAISEKYRYNLNTIEAFVYAKAAVLKTWEHYSGDVFYPISHPTIKDPKAAYIDAVAMCTLYADEYGRRRRELAGLIARHLINATPW